MNVVCYVCDKSISTQEISNIRNYNELTTVEQKQFNVGGNVQSLSGVGYELKKGRED